MPNLDWLPVYVAEVTETDLGDAGRNVKAANEFLPDSAGEIAPALDGLAKLPAPAVGEKILVLQSDSTNLERYYIPIRSELSSLSDDNSAVQIESEGNVEIWGGGDLNLEGANISVGDGATESAVLGDQLNTWLNKLVTQISLIMVTGNLGIPSSPPINAAAISALSGELAQILSQTVKIKS